MIVRAFVGVHLRNCTPLHVYFLTVRPVHQLLRQLAHKGSLYVVLCNARVCVLVRRIRSALNRCWKSQCLDFSNGKHLFTASLLALRLRLRHYSFIPVLELNYRAAFSWTILNINWVFLPTYVYFFENDLF